MRRYADGNEVVRDALRMLEERDELGGHSVEYLRAMPEAGRASGRPTEDGDAFLDRMEVKFQAMAE
jgi:Arc/MetJ-type ribon-helix-helix transcriptional regulator